MSSIVYCVAEFKAKKGKEQELFEALMALEPITYLEDGCIHIWLLVKSNHHLP